MRIKILVLLLAVVALFAAAEPTAKITNIQQKDPNNGIIEMECEVSGMVRGQINDETMLYIPIKTHVGSPVTTFTNGVNKLVWNSEADFGAIGIASNLTISVITMNGNVQWVQLWEGGPYWADRNVGASSPTDACLYFWWGDVIGYRWENGKWVASDGSNSNFSFTSRNCPTFGVSYSNDLPASMDAATAHLGSLCRMPTSSEFSALINNCTRTRTTIDGVYGMVFTGKGTFSDRSIFIPAAGFAFETSLDGFGSYGQYWSSSLYTSDSNYGWSLYFYSDNVYMDAGTCYIGHPVRAVRELAP